MAADVSPIAPPLRTLIVDDEPLAIERLQILCAAIADVALVGSATDGAAALRMVDALAPDLVLTDIDMPELDGMGVARALAGRPAGPTIVFVTAFDRFAVGAFDVAAADYLLKPVAPERLALAIVRARERRAGPVAAVTAWLDEIWVPHRAQVIRIDTRDIDRIEAERDYMRLWVGETSYLVHRTISELERRLDPARFVRLHRSAIVRKDRIARLSHDGAGTWTAELKCGTMVRIGRSHLASAKAMLAG